MSFEKYLQNEIPEVRQTESFCGLVGGERPSTYSPSPKMWNSVFKKIDIEAIYVPFDVTKENFRGFVDELRKEKNFRGMNVTVPYKKTIIENLEEIDPHAREYEAVNTVVKREGKLCGYNTDGIGEVMRLKEIIGDLKNKKILQIGAGGAGNSVSYALVQEGAELIISNRTVEKAKDLSMRLQNFFKLKNNLIYGDESIVQKYANDVDIILNVSLKGQHGSLENYSALAPADDKNNETSLRIAESVPSKTIFADVIYNPDETVFLKHGRETGHKTLNGYGMLVNQAVRSFEIMYQDEFKKSGMSSLEIAEIMRKS